MTPTTLVMAYYENPGMLREQFASIRRLPAKLRDLLHVVIVDDGSPDHPAVPEDIGCSLQIWRIGVDVRWNQDAARNIGVHHAETEWLLLTDMDHVVPEATWQPLLLRQYDRDVAYRLARVSAPDMAPYKPHPNSWFLTRKLFERAGGYDESFAGLYGTDALFRDALVPTAREIVMLKEVLIRYPREVIPDASTTRYLRKQPEDRAGIAALMRRRKADAAWSPKRLSFPYSRVA
ncbi:glycosyltransferase [Bradyrhizobium sp. JYMT SZCCT0428]|uniref:glycosyltransferase n=1 Tax=Bradyrhizobium sp. JYMT SZCCT0428 TaxID=2807673 RepID=UPI001BA745DF|nr:glycosyltransferase [Bradyrhizobium sp. JYMT SZCCT0428]MBR1150088.1 glycosyltransferase [Bradyrhizobium sp. JYMT SZCCT0428]